MIDKIDLNFESFFLPLVLTVDGERQELHLQDLPFAVYSRYQKEMKDKDNAYDALIDYAVSILNSNKEGVEFSKEYVEGFGAVKLMHLCQLYTEWLSTTIREKN